MCITHLVQGQSVVSFKDFESIKSKLNSTDTTYVVNLWATWCKPCVKELPYFLDLANEMSEKPVRFVLVSIDFKSHVETKLKPFILAHPGKVTYLHIDNMDYDSWLGSVDSDWSGAIPATLLIKGDARVFYESEFESKDELKSFLDHFEELANKFK